MSMLWRQQCWRGSLAPCVRAGDDNGGSGTGTAGDSSGGGLRVGTARMVQLVRVAVALLQRQPLACCRRMRGCAAADDSTCLLLIHADAAIAREAITHARPMAPAAPAEHHVVSPPWSRSRGRGLCHHIGKLFLARSMTAALVTLADIAMAAPAPRQRPQLCALTHCEWACTAHVSVARRAGCLPCRPLSVPAAVHWAWCDQLYRCTLARAQGELQHPHTHTHTQAPVHLHATMHGTTGCGSVRPHSCPRTCISAPPCMPRLAACTYTCIQWICRPAGRLAQRYARTGTSAAVDSHHHCTVAESVGHGVATPYAGALRGSWRGAGGIRATLPPLRTAAPRPLQWVPRAGRRCTALLVAALAGRMADACHRCAAGADTVASRGR